MALKLQQVRRDFIVQQLRRRMDQSALIAVAQTGNMGKWNHREVRRVIGAAGGEVAFRKNSLMRKSIELTGTPHLAELTPLLQNNICIATGPAEVPLAAALHSLSKQLPEFYVTGAIVNGTRLLQHTDFEKLAKMPSREEIDVRLVSQMMPGSALQVPNVAAYLLAVLQMHAEARGGGPPDA